tara:strand:- start:3501 stop:4109 length:609 start_codon:yes stop_codon:yes gene_type:complete
MSLQGRYPRSNSPKKLAWLLLPIMLVIGAIILLFGEQQPEKTVTGNLAPSEGLEGYAVEYRTPTASITDAVEQRLREFQARYRQAAPYFTVSHRGSDETLEAVATRVGSYLSGQGLGEYRGEHQPAAEQGVAEDYHVPAPLTVIAREQATPIVDELLYALQPYIKGRSVVIRDPQTALDEVQLRLNGVAKFDEQGRVILDER